MAVASYAPNPASANGPTREYRGAVTFILTATFMLVILLLVLGSMPSGQPARFMVTLAGPIVLMLVMFAAAFGLAQRAVWAIAAMTPLLYLLAVSGVISFVLALTRSTFEIPLGLILAIWALRAPPARATGSVGAVAAAVVAVAVTAALWVLPAEVLLRPGGPLIVDATALQPSLEVICTPSVGVDPSTVQVRYDWRWLRGEPWSGGHDVIQLEVFEEDVDNLLSFALDETDALPAGISQEDISIFPPLGMTFDVDLATTGFTPGSVGFRLIGPNNPSAMTAVTAQATYRHGYETTAGIRSAVWQVETSTRCEW